MFTVKYPAHEWRHILRFLDDVGEGELKEKIRKQVKATSADDFESAELNDDEAYKLELREGVVIYHSNLPYEEWKDFSKVEFYKECLANPNKAKEIIEFGYQKRLSKVEEEVTRNREAVKEAQKVLLESLKKLQRSRQIFQKRAAQIS